MNNVDRSQRFIDSGMGLAGDRPGEHAPKAPAVALDVSDDTFVPDGLRAWAGRVTNGFFVQGLVAADGTTFISCGFTGRNEHQTIEVPREDAAEAFAHPFAYGCTLSL